jgi:hypothetical protein
MPRYAVVAVCIAAIASCTAYDRARYMALVDATRDATMSADVSDAADDPPDLEVDIANDDDAPDATADVATCLDAATLVPTCTSVPALAHEPVIDGVPECEIAMQPFPPENFRSYMGSQPTDFSAEYGFAWRPNGLYVAFRVHRIGLFPAFASDEIYCGDAMEVFVDSDGVFAAPPGYDDPGTRQFMIPAPANTRDPVTMGVTYFDRMPVGAYSSNVRAIGTDDGYSGEAFVEAADLGLTTWRLAPDATIGVDVAVDLGKPASTATNCVRYAGQFVMHFGTRDGGYLHPSADVRAFCTPTLAAP